MRKNPRILIVTPEVTYLPDGMGNYANYMTAKAGGLADVSAALVKALFDLGADVHVALPDYRSMFSATFNALIRRELSTIRSAMPNERVHLAEDRAFFYQQGVYSNYSQENIQISLAFQREVINHILPAVQPDLIHCNDWMTGLIPAAARWSGVRSLFTIHNIHTMKTTLSHIEDRGIDAASFWQSLYYMNQPQNYEESRSTNPVDFLTTGVFAAHFVNTVSPTFLKEIVEGRHDFIPGHFRRELANKYNASCATGILNAPDPSYNPATDKALMRQYTPDSHQLGKHQNKRYLQTSLGLIRDDNAPIFFWPSRLDPAQKGPQLLSDILYRVVSRWWKEKLQIVFVANGEYQRIFRNIVDFHNFQDRVAVCEFSENLSRLCYAAADFVLLPSRFEPCGLPQMNGAIYGALPVVHKTGGLSDTVSHMAVAEDRGNGFVFESWDSAGLFWAMGEAMEYFRLHPEVRARQVHRVMVESAERFNHAVTARNYMDLYEKMLSRPLIPGNA